MSITSWHGACDCINRLRESPALGRGGSLIAYLLTGVAVVLSFLCLSRAVQEIIVNTPYLRCKMGFWCKARTQLCANRVSFRQSVGF